MTRLRPLLRPPCRGRRRHWVFVALLSACGSAADEPSAAGSGALETVAEETSAAAPTPAELAARTDARDAEALLPYVREGAVETRRATAWALARVHDDTAAAGLITALRDPDAEVRRAAAFGLGALEHDAPPEAVDALLGALAAEPQPTTAGSLGGPPEVVRGARSTMVWSLARTASPRVVPALEAGLTEDTESAVAVCRGLAYGGAWPASLLEAALERASHDPASSVREACWQGLGRVTIPADLAPRVRERATEALAAATEPEIRVQTARQLGRVPATEASLAILARASADPEWRVGVAALRSLGTLTTSGHETALAATLDQVFARWWPEGAERPEEGGAVHVLLTALEVAGPFARSEPIYQRAQTWQTRTGRAPSSRDVAWLACRSAQLVDLGRGWPGRVEACGQGLLDDDVRRALSAEILAAGQGAEPQRVTFLERLFREGGPRAREAVLAAAAHLSVEAALPFVRRGLEDADEGVTLAGLELLRSVAPVVRRRRDDAAVAASLRGERVTPERVLAELDPVVLAAGRRLLSGESLEGRVALADTVAVLADPGATPDGEAFLSVVRPLAAHASQGVRTAARAALTALADPDPPPPDESVEASLDASSLQDLPHHAHLETDRGPIELELFAERSPTTVARFAELAREGFFNGLNFHRVVAGFVAQGGDPRGDGYGGPAFWQRCEDSPLAYERGTVGMALAGRDTGGSQFFITLGPQHHLDGRYTVFARVTSGLEHVDALQVGDAITTVSTSP